MPSTVVNGCIGCEYNSPGSISPQSCIYYEVVSYWLMLRTADMSCVSRYPASDANFDGWVNLRHHHRWGIEANTTQYMSELIPHINNKSWPLSILCAHRCRYFCIEWRRGGFACWIVRMRSGRKSSAPGGVRALLLPDPACWCRRRAPEAVVPDAMAYHHAAALRLYHSYTITITITTLGTSCTPCLRCM